jgi:hypothetical protein
MRNKGIGHKNINKKLKIFFNAKIFLTKPLKHFKNEPDLRRATSGRRCRSACG